MDDREDNCKSGGMNRRGWHVARAGAHRRMSYYLRQVSRRTLPLSVGWRAAASRSESRRKGEAARNNYPGKWVLRCGEHVLNSPGGGRRVSPEKPIATFKWAQRLRFFIRDASGMWALPLIENAINTCKVTPAVFLFLQQRKLVSVQIFKM